MPLCLLLDENISPVVTDQVRKHRSEIEIETIFRWQGGSLVSQKDEPLLLAAAAEGWTLVTYDQKTIPPLLERLLERGHSHAGIVYIDERTIANADFGTLVKALIRLWDFPPVSEWKDYVHHLDRPPR